MARVRPDLERVAVGDDEVGDLARLDGADAVADSEYLGGVDGDSRLRRRSAG
jgi:hypothetical protein